jgi:roadblock/LC7 domain-containing protein
VDSTTIGLPANGILFSYDPVYPVTPVAQVVTATPIVTSKSANQTFTQTLNGTPYSYVYTTTDTVTTTPNSFPNATFQVASVTWTRTNNTLYQITINGITVSYTSDATATDAEITAGLIAALNANATISAAITPSGTKPLIITSDVLGQAFTITGSNTTPTITTANVPIEQYTQTINGTAYTFVSDGTPTATEVVTGLKALINADGPQPVTATGTTTLILTADSVGVDFTNSTSSNMSTVDNTVSPTATQVVTGLKTVINADGPLPITATGTTTLIMTADAAGTAFTYSTTANLTDVLTTANVAQVLYSGNWVCSVINASTVTSVDSGVPVVAGRWDSLSATVDATGSTTYFYVNNLLVATVVTPVPLVGLRFAFKLEKTLGTVSRTTSIDYIFWNKER